MANVKLKIAICTILVDAFCPARAVKLGMFGHRLNPRSLSGHAPSQINAPKINAKKIPS